MVRYFWFILLFLALFTRFWGLNWGQGFFFHPDENNMARGILQLERSRGYDPQFYAYGEFPLYLSWFMAKLSGQLNWAGAIFWLRFWAALFSFFTVVLGYLFWRRLGLKPVWLYPFLLIFSPGLIQAAHFGTTETALSFALLGTTFLLFRFWQQPSRGDKFFLLWLLLAAFALANKVSALAFVLPAWFIFLLLAPGTARKRLLVLSLLLPALSCLFSPIYWQFPQRVWQTIHYEGEIARGQLAVFYTRQFVNTYPFLFQLRRVFPWLLGWPAWLAFLASLAFFFRRLTWPRVLIALPSLAWFLANGCLWVKWTRFMLPLLPELLLLLAIFLAQFQRRRFFLFLLFLLSLPAILFMSLYFRSDVRWQASRWLNHLPRGTKILEESGNVVNLPLVNSNDLKVFVLNFYQLDNNFAEQRRLAKILPEVDYVLLASRRVFANYQRLPGQFPQTANFYRQLFKGDLGFHPVKVFLPFPKVINWFLGSDLASEETWTVFDHPTIRVFGR